MPASSNLIGDITTVIASGPTALTQAKAIAPAGRIMDYIGNTTILKAKFQETSVLLNFVKGNTDAGTDATNLALINKVLAALNGTSTPSTTLITDLTTVINNGPSTVTQTNSIAAAGRIMDYIGNCNLCRLKLKESQVLIGYVIGDTDAGDGSLSTLNNIQTALS
jgi:hypothetical protein